MEYAYRLLAIECLNALFWNYTRHDIEQLKERHGDSAYVWEAYIADKSGQEAFNMLWECWMVKFTLDTKNGLIGYALDKYGVEKREFLESAYLTRRLWNRLDNEE